MKCQKCRQPIRLHSSLEDLSPAAFNLLTGKRGGIPPTTSDTPIGPPLFPPDRRDTYDKAAQNASAPIHKRTIPTRSSTAPARPKSVYQNPAESYVMLTQSQLAPAPLPPSSSSSSAAASSFSRNNNTTAPPPPQFLLPHDENALSHQMHTSAGLFDILSARSDIDYPICSECTDLLVEGLTKRLANATRERDAYVEFLKRVHSEIPTEAERDAAVREMTHLQDEEAAALRELAETERARAAVEDEIRGLEEEARALEGEEEAFWRERNGFAARLEEFQNERDGVNLQYDHDSRQLEKLQRTNVYNDTFCIGHDGYFGTINGLRLGRLQAQPVEWTEINAAWGQTLLLLSTICDKLTFTPSTYRLRPMGSTSRIERLDYPASGHGEPKVTTLELFSSGDLPLGRMFMHRKFDQAMVAFLECLRQLGEYVERTDAEMKLPYRIVKDKIGDSCIRLAFNQDEAWTRACKYTLTCVKFLLAHTR
ncbi:APG6-domain-containing protein [Morchella conica CCBAS932]|uniref:APG6-domain-containing protein n=1 Tax=Morchella conica CCBAS932 TaxID=1392247 RepID=A0A3N4KV29_9PEZI|nr:APG6-domain-containing protein [Morchella conica CCBAS932]